MRKWIIAAVLVTLGFCVSTASATIYTYSDTIPLFDGTYHGPNEPYPLPAVHVGDFSIAIPGSQFIVSATVSGQWGNANMATTARNELFVDGVLVADTDWYTPDPYYAYYTPWSYTFTDFSVLQDGAASFDAVQTSEYVIRLAPTTLTIQTSDIPEPASIIVWSLLGALVPTVACWRRRRKRKA